MQNVKLLKSVFEANVIDDNASLEILKFLHERGTFNLVQHLREQAQNDIQNLSTRKAIDSLIEKLNVMRELIPSDGDEDIIVEERSVEDIMGDR